MNVAIIDDQEFIRYSVKKILKQKNLKVYEFTGQEENLLEELENLNINILILDVMLEFEKSGIDILEEIREKNLDIQVILMTAFTTPENVIRANSLDVVEVLKKPFEESDLLDIVKNVLQSSNQKYENILSIEGKQNSFVGSFESMKDIYKKIGVASKNNLTILVSGDTGTGKELVAKLIHENSLNSKEPFISINCTSIPSDLFESQLFGHEKGSFTGATSQHIGYAQQVEKGTLFLDEIGDLDINLQSKILRFLENRSFRKIGGYKELPFEGRIIAATNIDFKKAINEKKFREDLYFRLSMINIHLPPLNDRKDDIPLLVEHFIKRANSELQCNVTSISQNAIDILKQHNWTGNIRELRNTIYNAVLGTFHETINETDLQYIENKKDTNSHCVLENLIDEKIKNIDIKDAQEFKYKLEKQFFKSCVELCGNITHLSNHLNMSRATLRKRLKEFDIDYND